MCVYLLQVLAASVCVLAKKRHRLSTRSLKFKLYVDCSNDTHSFFIFLEEQAAPPPQADFPQQPPLQIHCNTLQHITAHCNTHLLFLKLIFHNCNMLQHTATHYNTLQHAAAGALKCR